MDKNKLKLEIPTTTILKVVGALLLVYFIFFIRDILVLLTASFILAAALEPLIDQIQIKIKLPRWLGVLIVYIILITFFYIVASIISPVLSQQFGTLIANRVEYMDRLNNVIQTLPQQYQDQLNAVINGIPTDLGSIYHGVFNIFSGLAGFFIVLVISFYILSLKNGMKKTLSDIIPVKHQPLFIHVFEQITRKIGHWVGGQLILSLAVGLITFIGLWIMHIPYAVVLSLIAAFTELIPLIGPFLGAIPAIIVAFFVNPIMALVVAIFYIFVQQVENHILVPQVMKRAVGLNPIVVIVVMLIGGKLLGIIGVLLAVPVASAISVVIKELSKTEVSSGN